MRTPDKKDKLNLHRSYNTSLDVACLLLKNMYSAYIQLSSLRQMVEEPFYKIRSCFTVLK